MKEKRESIEREAISRPAILKGMQYALRFISLPTCPTTQLEVADSPADANLGHRRDFQSARSLERATAPSPGDRISGRLPHPASLHANTATPCRFLAVLLVRREMYSIIRRWRLTFFPTQRQSVQLLSRCLRIADAYVLRDSWRDSMSMWLFLRSLSAARS